MVNDVIVYQESRIQEEKNYENSEFEMLTNLGEIANRVRNFRVLGDGFSTEKNPPKKYDDDGLLCVKCVGNVSKMEFRGLCWVILFVSYHLIG